MIDLPFSVFSLHFSPLIPAYALLLLAMFCLALWGFSLWRVRALRVGRTLACFVFLLVLANPSVIEEERTAAPDVAVIVVDESQSQSFGKRMDRAENALAAVLEKLNPRPSLDVRVTRAPKDGAGAQRTDLFNSVQTLFADVPESRRAGVILLTDGQVHDVPERAESLSAFGPVHTLLTGEKGERDRQIKILSAPAYGLAGEEAEIRYSVVDTPGIGAATTNITMRWGGRYSATRTVAVGVEQTARFPIDNAGQNVIEIEVDDAGREITLANNKAAIVVNGVRDRLKVLLVSGQPHNGGRMWRDMLSSDPGVDLVHFTILREPDKLDQTPQDELSLIAFPFQELFEIKLYDFDLIIFDRYELNPILPNYYFANIVRYVKEGGALLEASGPSFSNEFSIYNSELAEILPGQPTGEVVERPFRPTLSGAGLRHPVTMDFASASENWGPWLRQIGIAPKNGDVVMEGADGQPLVVLSRVGKGRVAQIASDHIWLWARGYRGGGPQRDLLRRTAHWLMKEPELDESAFTSVIGDDAILLKRRSLDDAPLSVDVLAPDGTKSALTLSPGGAPGWLGGEIPITQNGVYSVSDGEKSHFIVVGTLGAPEMNGVISTEEFLAPAAKETGGSVRWLSDFSGVPDIRHVEAGRKYSGAGWMGLRRNHDYAVTGVKDRALLPPLVSLLLLAGGCLLLWWREGRSA